MLHRKLLLRRLAYVPWLLAVGLVLGWSGVAVADPPVLPAEKDHGKEGKHTHVTDPYLSVSYKLASTAEDTIFVSWNTAYSKNFHNDVEASSGNGTAATSYTLTVQKGESPANLAAAPASSLTITSATGAVSGDGYQFTDANVDIRRAVFILNLEDPTNASEALKTGPGFYWVRMVVQVPDGDIDDPPSAPQPGYFAKQIAVQPDYMLSLNRASVREDDGATDVTVRVDITQDETDNDDEVAARDTSVPLRLGTNQVGLNERFRIETPTITIPKGKKGAEGTIRFTPIPDDDTKTDEDLIDDDLLVTVRTTGAATADASVDIRLVDTDKPSSRAHLSVSHSAINTRADRTEVTVTATLNGKKINKSLNIFLQEDKSFAGSANRGVDYYMSIDNPLTIPRNRISGSTKVYITPRGKEDGIIRLTVEEQFFPQDQAGNKIRLDGVSISLTGDTPVAEDTGLTATPFSMREDAVEKRVTLKISLQNPVSSAEEVVLSVYDVRDDKLDIDALGKNFDGAVGARRDRDFDVVGLNSFTIPKGEKEGRITITVELKDNDRDDDPRAFSIGATVGGIEHFAGILITDDDSTSEEITLSVNQDEINEGDGATPITVTGTLHGKAFAGNVVVPLTIETDFDGAASRDIDYTTTVSPLVIPGGQTEGTITFTITPKDNDGKEDNETIRLAGLETEAEDESGDTQELTVGYVDITLIDSGAKKGDAPQDPTEPQDPTRPTFTDAHEISDQTYMVGEEIDDLVLPEPAGGDAPMTYSVSTLPAGLSFDADSRTLSGTPTEETAGAVNVIYTVIDNDRDVAATIFSITVEEGELPTPVADAQLTVTPAAIREDAGATQISLAVTLTAAKTATEVVTFTIVAPSEGATGRPAVRDVDYSASLGAIVSIPAGTTVGTATLTLTPMDNTLVDGLRVLGVQAAFASGAALVKDIKIVDDETPSSSITLSANPSTVSEESGRTIITITATLDGKALAEDAAVTVSVDGSSTATRDVDYAAVFNPVIDIPAGSITGSTPLALQPINDDLAEGSETIILTGVIDGLLGDEVVITLTDQAAMNGTGDPDDPDDPGDPDDTDDEALAFAAGTVIDDQEFTEGTAIAPLVLPKAAGGTGDLTYSLTALPAGLSFDSTTRTISGTPSEATDSAVAVVYTVVDEGGSAAVLIFSIMVNSKPQFDLGGFFDSFGSGKIVPTTSHDLAGIREFIVGQRVEGIVLPAASGGTAPLRYSISPALPAGLAFDAATRTISGTPRAEGETAYTYAVTDASGASASLSLQTLPTEFALADNFPNPFNPATTIQYALPHAADVELTVYNVVGQVVRTLVAEHQSSGRYVVEWDATNDSGHSLSSGMYFYRLQAGGEFHEVKKMLLLK